LGKFAESAATLGRYETAEAALGEAEAIHSPSAPERLRLLLYRATLSSLRGDSAAAISAYERLREEQHALGNRSGEVRALMNGAEIEYARGSTERAVANVRAALAVIATDTNRQLRSMLLGNLAGYLVAAGDVEAGCRAGREAIRGLAAAEPTSPYAIISLEHLALGLALGGDHPRAALLAGYVDAAMRGGEITREFTEQTTHDRLAALLQERLGGDELERRHSEGAGLTGEAAIALALEEP
jgi:ATP/maltotriose-dependent transcriptional regulator MalT